MAYGNKEGQYMSSETLIVILLILFIIGMIILQWLNKDDKK